VLVRGYGDKGWQSRLTLAIARILLTKNGEHSWEEVSLDRMAVINEMMLASWMQQAARFDEWVICA